MKKINYQILGKVRVPIGRRALTPEQKKEILDRLLKLWLSGDNHYLRLGQLVNNYLHEGDRLYHIEDYDLIEELEKKYDESKNV